MYNRTGAQAYQQVGLESSVMAASQSELLILLFDGAISAIVRARLFMQEGQTESKGNAISKAINIIENGLKRSLIAERGDELADNLISLYDYMVRRLTLANLRNDPALTDEVETLLRGISDAWKEANGVLPPLQDAI